MNSSRYLWTAGPLLVAGNARLGWHAGKNAAILGPKTRLLVGQVRDLHTGFTLNWAFLAPVNRTNARLAITDLYNAFPRSEDWTPDLKRGASEIPTGWTPRPYSEDFQLGLII